MNWNKNNFNLFFFWEDENETYFLQSLLKSQTLLFWQFCNSETSPFCSRLSLFSPVMGKLHFQKSFTARQVDGKILKSRCHIQIQLLTFPMFYPGDDSKDNSWSHVHWLPSIYIFPFQCLMGQHETTRCSEKHSWVQICPSGFIKQGL